MLEREASDLGVTSFHSIYDAGYTSSALKWRSMIGFNYYEVIEYEVKATDMFHLDDDYQTSPPQYILHSPQYFPMPPTPWNSSYNDNFFEEDDYFLEPPSPNNLVEDVTHLVGNEYFPVPSRVHEFNYPSLEAEEDDEYNPEPPIYPKINYLSEDEQHQGGPHRLNKVAFDDMAFSDDKYNLKPPLGFSSKLSQESNEYFSNPLAFSD
ncbi:hypothetical protein R1flu_001356 [Riccia fluitans]|uniref:Uncharacterized protein n=1 Tax=Riccia fluitans TaxID=41844 RepID=A0ABD1Y3E4_9MARC